MRISAAHLRWPLFTVAFVLTSCGPEGLQRQDQFAWAINQTYLTTSPPLVRVRLVDAKTGTSTIRCMSGSKLIDAISVQNNLPDSSAGFEKARSIALGSLDHSFRFDQPALQKLAQWTGEMDDEESKACKLIEHGKSAIWSDYSARVVEGPQFPVASGGTPE